MDQQQIKSFIDAMAQSDLSEMEFSKDGWTLRLARGPVARPVTASLTEAMPVSSATQSGRLQVAMPAFTAATKSFVITAPLYGVVHLRPSPSEPAFVETGASLRAGQTLCVVEAMKVFNEVRAERDGVVEAVLVSSGQEVEAGQPLFRFA